MDNIKPMSADEYEFQKLLNLHNVVYFTAPEIFRPFRIHPLGKTPPVTMWQTIIPTILVLDALRKDLDFPLYINSTYRCEEHNKAVNGVKNSFHMKFAAIDFTTRNQKRLKILQDRLRQWDKKNDLYIKYNNDIITPQHVNMGIKYDTFVHLDTGVYWGFNNKPKRW